MKEKIHNNKKRYEELCKQYKISYFKEKYNSVTKSFELINFSDYDIIIKPGYIGRDVQYFQVIKSPEEVTDSDLALICYKGNYVPGFSVFANYIIVKTIADDTEE